MASLSIALLAGGSLIDLDGTIFVQLAVFFIAFLVLRALVFKPMVALFEAREQAIDGARHEAKRMEREAVEKGKQFDDALRKIRLEAGEERDRLRQEGQRLERAVLDKVRKETQATLATAEKKVAEESTRATRELQATVPGLARQIASRLLGREISA